jgi:uncharacterized protein YggE
MHAFFAASLLAFPAMPAAAQSEPRTIAMSGHGAVKAAPDTATLTAGVTVQAATATAALAADNTRMQAVIAVLKKAGIADKAIQTARFSVAPQYAYASGQVPKLTGYQATNQVSVRLDDIGKVGVLLDALVGAGANQESSINFSIAHPEPLLADARVQAVADARERAQTYAKAAGVSLGPILSISENSIVTARPIAMRAMAAFTAPPPAPPPIEAGEESVSADVSIVWQIQ